MNRALRDAVRCNAAPYLGSAALRLDIMALRQESDDTAQSIVHSWCAPLHRIVVSGNAMRRIPY
jgi:hypothetical protein